MIEEYVPQNQRRDDFFERYLEHTTGKLKSFTEPLVEDSIPFPIKPLHTAPTTTSNKRDSSDSASLRSPLVSSSLAGSTYYT